jgi:hypothetical protein
MKKLSNINSKKKFIILVSVILILLALSQWWTIRMIYARKLNNDTALFFAKIYYLKAAQVVTGDNKLNVYLGDYIAEEKFDFDYIKKQVKAANQEQNINDQQIREIVWDKVLRQVWVSDLATRNKISTTKQDFEDFYTSAGGKENLEKNLKNEGIDKGDYKNLVIKPSIMEAKVYKYLLDNFNDLSGMQKAQNAYQALVEDNGVFEDVAKEFSDDMSYSDNSMFINVEQLGELGEPIKNLQTGEYSKIMVLPGNPAYYMIWRLQGTSIDEESKQTVKELRGIAIKAKSMDEFYADWKNNSQINKWYK